MIGTGSIPGTVYVFPANYTAEVSYDLDELAIARIDGSVLGRVRLRAVDATTSTSTSKLIKKVCTPLGCTYLWQTTQHVHHQQAIRDFAFSPDGQRVHRKFKPVRESPTANSGTPPGPPAVRRRNRTWIGRHRRVRAPLR